VTDPRMPEFEAVPGWGEALPDLTQHDVSDLTIGPADEVCVLYRDLRSAVVADTDGMPRRSLGPDVVGSRPHGVTIADDGTFFLVDEGDHCVRVVDPAGREIGRFGTGPSNPDGATGVVSQGYPPFCRPTRLAIAPSGDLYVSDGYGNARVHRYTHDHELIRSWGEPGSGPGEFNLPHAVHVDGKGRVLVCDRENDRIQVFSADGDLIDLWTGVQRPQALAEDADGLLYVAEGAWREGHVSPHDGPVAPAPSRVSVLDHEGRPLGHVGGERPGPPGTFVAAHAIALDSRGDLYVAEVSTMLLAQLPDPELPSWVSVQKLRRVS
jgi:hypothetical protein